MSEMITVINSLNQIQADMAVPKNVRTRIESIIGTLEKEAEISIKVNKALNELDEVASDSNIQSYTRTEIWNVISVLEKL